MHFERNEVILEDKELIIIFLRNEKYYYNFVGLQLWLDVDKFEFLKKNASKSVFCSHILISSYIFMTYAAGYFRTHTSWLSEFGWIFFNDFDNLGKSVNIFMLNSSIKYRE